MSAEVKQALASKDEPQSAMNLSLSSGVSCVRQAACLCAASTCSCVGGNGTARLLPRAAGCDVAPERVRQRPQEDGPKGGHVHAIAADPGQGLLHGQLG
eukprot:123491-Lingulodinium_polyedra.AAC.1